MNLRTCIGFLILVCCLSSCGERNANEHDEQISTVNVLLNDKDYEEAIAFLEILLIQVPGNEEFSSKLCHAYAGAGGFDAIRIVRLIDEFEQSFLEGQFANFLDPINNFLAELSLQNLYQQSRLNQGIDFCNEVRLSHYSTSTEYKIKQGLLHGYRLLNIVKESLMHMSEFALGNNILSKDQYQEFYDTRINLMWQDLVILYDFYGKSNENLRHNVETIDSEYVRLTKVVPRKNSEYSSVINKY